MTSAERMFAEGDDRMTAAEAFHAVRYATERAKATRTRYLITNMGHVWMDCPENRRGIDDCGGLYAVIGWKS